jgi:large subunit ribosomal protein L25
MVTLTINGTPRTVFGKAATKTDRKSGQIPCVMYGCGNDTVHFTTSLPQIRNLIYSPDFKTVEINVEGKSYRCILKEVQFDPVTDAVTHIDFLQLVQGRSVKVEVPLRFSGTAPGVRSGGKFIQKLRSIKIKVRPENLVDEVVADISKLKLGQSLRIRDIGAVQGVEILNPPALPIATITIPRGVKAGAEEEEAAE